MFSQYIHIIAFDIPYPVDHGGFYDLFYKLVALHQQKVRIFLHCFEYGKRHQDELNKYCEKVIYYDRQTGLRGLTLSLPYIVASRRNSLLIQNLSKDNHPILLEGTHCTYLLYKDIFPGRTILYRLHNIESIYYDRLYKTEINFLKKLYFLIESKLLKNYERKVLPKAKVVLTVSEMDAIKVKSEISSTANVVYLPVFMPYFQHSSLVGYGHYCLYHGNLSVAENEQAALWLLENVFHNFEMPFIIAGRKPSKRLLAAVNQNDNARIIADPSEKEISDLIQKAHINIIISLNETGIKLKLINALFQGRHCIANCAAIQNTGLDKNCHLANTADEIKTTILYLQKQCFTQVEIEERRQTLNSIFNNEANAQKLIKLLY